MRCAICREFFSTELTFRTLFCPPKLCEACQTFLAKDYEHTSFPSPGGVIDHYLLVLGQSDYHMDYLNGFRLEKALKMAISQCNEIDLIVIVDVNESRTISAWYPLIAHYQRVVIFSLVDIDFSHTIQP